MPDSTIGWLVLVRRGTVIAALSLWIGAIAFYGAVVVPTGAKVLGSATAQGFVTQQVTVQLNVIAMVALAALAWNVLASSRTARRPLALTWLVMLAAQVALFALHPYVGALLDATEHRVTDPEAFYARHRVYLMVTTGQWLAAVTHGAFAVVGWRAEDRAA